MSLKIFLEYNYVAIAGFAFLYVFLRENTNLDLQIRRDFHTMITLELIELFAYNIEIIFGQMSTPTIWRTLFSVIGYVVRPALIYVVILIHTRHHLSKKMKKLLLLPILITAVIMGSSFFCGIAFSYNETNNFIRGPLGYTSQVVIIVYMLVLFGITVRSRLSEKKLETEIILMECVYLAGTILADSVYEIKSIGRTGIIFCTLFYFMFFQTKDFRRSLDEEQKIRDRAVIRSRTDNLTGLLNKEVILEEAQNKLNLQDGKNRAFVFLDIDYFKNVNDTLGHMTGDRVLYEVGTKLARFLNENEEAGRFGGDEFCLVIETSGVAELESRLEELNKMLRLSYSINGSSVRVSASVGAVYAGADCNVQINEVMQLADKAVYEAKRAGRDCFVLKKL